MISPDGNWLAFASDRSGRLEVYVQAFPNGGELQAISAGGGTEPLWGARPGYLFYRHDDQVLRVTVDPGPPFLIKATEVVIEGTFERAAGYGAPNYEVDVDGTRFLMSHKPQLAPNTASELRVVLNWLDELASDVW